MSHTSHVLTEMMPPDLSVEIVVLTGKRATLSPWFQAIDEADRRRARHLLEQVGCGDLAARPFATGSQGERQRVLLARALYSEPEPMILDEPASGLDLPSREALIEALETVASGPVAPTTLVATHHLEEIAPSTTHAALLRERAGSWRAERSTACSRPSSPATRGPWDGTCVNASARR